MRRKTYGLLAEFAEPRAIVGAARQAVEAGYTRLEAYTPFPIEALAETLGHASRGRLPRIVLGGGVLGGLAGYLLQDWVAAQAYPLNIGGRPAHSWPAFVPVTFEMTILGAALAAVVGLLALNGLPMPYHPLFNVGPFGMASRDRFFLCIEAVDPRFDAQATRRFLERLEPLGVYDVDP
jgi:hypothetical protein